MVRLSLAYLAWATWYYKYYTLSEFSLPYTGNSCYYDNGCDCH